MAKTVFFAVILSLLLLACTDTITGKSIAEPKVAVFHQLFNAGEYEQIYADASADFQKAAPAEKVLSLFAAMGRKLGKVKSSSLKNWSVTTYNLTTRVVLVEDTQFAKGSGMETFTFLVADGKASLLGYNINSMDLMIH